MLGLNTETLYRGGYSRKAGFQKNSKGLTRTFYLMLEVEKPTCWKQVYDLYRQPF